MKRHTAPSATWVLRSSKMRTAPLSPKAGRAMCLVSAVLVAFIAQLPDASTSGSSLASGEIKKTCSRSKCMCDVNTRGEVGSCTAVKPNHVSTSTAVKISCGKGTFPASHYAYLRSLNCDKIIDVWSEVQQRNLQKAPYSSRRWSTISLAELPTYKAESAKCKGPWTLETNRDCMKDVLFVAQAGKKAIVRCGNNKITITKTIVGTGEKCGGRFNSVAISCNGKHSCELELMSDHARLHNCRESERVALFGTFGCSPTAPSNVENWTTTKTDSKTSLYEGRVMDNRCPEGTSLAFSDARFGASGDCPGADVTAALNKAAKGKNAVKIPITLSQLGLEKDPCLGSHGFDTSILTVKGVCEGHPIGDKCMVDNGGCPENSQCTDGSRDEVTCTCNAGFVEADGNCTKVSEESRPHWPLNGTIKIAMENMPPEFSVRLIGCARLHINLGAGAMVFEPGDWTPSTAPTGGGSARTAVKAPVGSRGTILLHRDNKGLLVYLYSSVYSPDMGVDELRANWVECPFGGVAVESASALQNVVVYRTINFMAGGVEMTD